jgi:hydrogenase expression/formation protein HypE
LDKINILGFNCPVPDLSSEKVLLAHGGGGLKSGELIQDIFLKEFCNEYLEKLHDGSVVNINGSRIAFTTDSFVIDPIFFPGGNIGELAVYGTVNDLAMCGAVPLYISTGFIIEEGFEINVLKTIVRSMQEAAERSGVKIITGDTKVVDKGKGDKLFINTSGIGVVREGVSISAAKISPGDKIILSGTIADHGMAVLSARENLDFISNIKSDTAPLNGLIEIILNETHEINMMRDPTRGGVAGVLNEIAKTAGVRIIINENRIRIKEQVRAACELIGYDPLYIANEGKCIIILPEDKSRNVLNRMREHPLGTDAEIIGEVSAGLPGEVILKTIMGTGRTLDMQPGDQLPRIC